MEGKASRHGQWRHLAAAGHRSPSSEDSLSNSGKSEGDGLREGPEGQETGRAPQRSINREERTERLR